MSATRSPDTAKRAQPRRTRWAGLVFFAGVMMIMLGFFQAIAGLAAIFNDDHYGVTKNGLVFNLDYSVWGWVHLLVGVAIFLAGMGVLGGNTVARAVGVGLAVISALLALAFAAADPGWAVIVIAIDVLVIYALTAHGRELADAF